jgi:UDP-N-acetyl-D-glucosamine dehydrogenase
MTRLLLEAALLWVSAGAAIFAWAQPGYTGYALVLSASKHATVLTLCCILSFYYNDLYDFRVVRSFRDFGSRLLQSFGVAFVLLAACYAFLPAVRVQTGAFGISLVAVVCVLVPFRALGYTLMRRRLFLERVLLLGRGPIAEKILREIEARPHFGYEIVGVADDASAASTHHGYPVLGPLTRLREIIAETRPNRIIVALSERRARLPVRQLLDARVNGCIVEDGVDTYERLSGKIAIESLTPSNLIYSRDFKKSRPDLTAGRVTSLAVAIVGLIVCAPIFGLIALAIKLQPKRDRGPLFFVQERLGLQGRSFKLIKFRTMRVVDGPTSEWVTDNHERITRLGGVLRKFRLDELPQFINVIRGDMNLVGPRPHPVTNVELFGEGIPYYSLRSAVRPGITGWAQIRLGYANNLEEETEKMRYDLYYIKHLSFWLDMRILFDTVKTVLFGQGSQSVERYERPAATEPKAVRTQEPNMAVNPIDPSTEVTVVISTSLEQRIRDHSAHIAIIGQGYVGLPLATEFARVGFTVSGIDNDPDRVTTLNMGRSCTPDLTDKDLQSLIRAGKYAATTDFSVLQKSDVVIICVPTPLRKSKDPDISYVVAAGTEVATRFHPGQLVVLESTTYPETTEELLLPMFEPKGAKVGEDLFLAFSPERIDPGNPTFRVGDIPKIVGGVTAECTRLTAALYRQIVPKVREVSSPKVAELAKLYENVFRNVNIALANEFAQMCRRLNVNSKEVIDAAATKPFGFMPFYPGPGIGGHCIPIDPLYLSWKLRLDGYESRFIALADDINRSMPHMVVEMVTQALNTQRRSVNGAQIIALGVAYKKGVGDLRESPALEVMELLRARGAEVSYADPHVPSITFEGHLLKAIEPTDAVLGAADCVVILTDHAEFDYARTLAASRLVIDTRNATFGLPAPAGRVVRL